MPVTEAASCVLEEAQKLFYWLQEKHGCPQDGLALKVPFLLSKAMIIQLSHRRRWLALCCSPNGALLR